MEKATVMRAPFLRVVTASGSEIHRAASMYELMAPEEVLQALRQQDGKVLRVHTG
jgi:hypothetical protein